MECPKCHSIIRDDATSCPHCHKVFLLECPNCHSLEESAVCTKCGYTILIKCSKCSKTSLVTDEKCSKCGLSLNTSLAYQECETDEFASIIVKFESLKKIRKLLKTKELYNKFFYKLKNLLFSTIKNVDGKVITYGEKFVINFNKELSFATSANKAIRLALKIANVFSELNRNVIDELAMPLGINLTIVKKAAEKLQDINEYETNVKMLMVKKNSKKYLKGMQVALDQYVQDAVCKDYKTDTLYSVENNGNLLMFYEVLLDSYVLPPETNSNENKLNVSKVDIKAELKDANINDKYDFKVFDINAKCHFEKLPVVSLENRLKNFDYSKKDKIISLRTTHSNPVDILSVADALECTENKVIRVTCDEKMNYTPWGFLQAIFKNYLGIPFNNSYDSSSFDELFVKRNKQLFELISGRTVKSMTPEDARFSYMDCFINFLKSLKDTVIIADNFENIDDTSIQTLELYYDKYKNIKPAFVFINDSDYSIHSKIKSLLRTDKYTELTLLRSEMDAMVSTLKSDATDFIKSFYYEKIEENCNGSFYYFTNAVKYLEETGVLYDFENKLIVKEKKSVVLPKNIRALEKARIKNLSKNADVSFIFAYAAMLGEDLNIDAFQQLGVVDVEKHIKELADLGYIKINKGIIYFNNYSRITEIILDSLKPQARSFLAKNVLAKIGKTLNDTNMFSLMAMLDAYKEEYLILWKNSQLAINCGDYDAYLKNCLGFLSLIGKFNLNISAEDIDNNKKEIYSNILTHLYNYSPTKVYFIEKILLKDAFNEGDDEKIKKLSNLMLQGSLIFSNYTDTKVLLNNILSRMENSSLFVNGELNSKFLLFMLVQIEIMYSLGEYKDCIEISNELLDVLSKDVIEMVKPESFSVGLFISHLIDTFRLTMLAMIYTNNSKLEVFIEKVEKVLETDFPEKDCIIAVRDFLDNKQYEIKDVENYSAFSKMMFLILQEFSVLKDDYKRFAQNIYQAKLLASETHQKEIELFCDLMIAYAYSKIGITVKAESIYSDVLEKAELTSMYNIQMLAKYLMAGLHIENSNVEAALLLVNSALATMQRANNIHKLMYVMFEKLYIDIIKANNITSVVSIETEELKLDEAKYGFSRLLNIN